MNRLLAVRPRADGMTELTIDVGASLRAILTVPTHVWATLSRADLDAMIDRAIETARPPLRPKTGV